MTQPPHVHRFILGADPASPPLVFLHGSGNDEHDLVPLTEEFASGSPVPSIRGTVAIDGAFAFFHRFPDRSIDEADVTARTPVLADYNRTVFANQSVTTKPIAIGFSNGAIMAAALLVTRPSLLVGATLFRPLSPFTNGLRTQLDAAPVLVIDSEKDSRRSPGDGLRLAERLIRVSATVTHDVLTVGYLVTAMDRQITRGSIYRLLDTPSDREEAT